VNWQERHARGGAPPRTLLRATFALCISLLVPASLAAAPEAGTVIQNQAAASYEPCLDATCATSAPVEAVTSNLVETIVQQVAGLALTNDQTRPISPGGIAFLQHQLVNLGNGPDRYELCIESVSSDIATWAVFADVDGDGVADSATPLFDQSDPDGCADALTPSLPPGAPYDFVIEVAVPAGVPAGSRPTLDVRATSDLDALQTETNLDTLEVVDGPVIEVTKRIEPSSGPSPASSVRVRLSLRNTGLSAATDLIVEDVLPTQTASGAAGGMRFVAGSGRWTELGSTPLTDQADGQEGLGPDFVDFCAYDGLGVCDDRIRFVISDLASGGSSEISFDVDIDAGISDAERLLNDVTFSYRDATGTAVFGDPVPFRSNTVAYVVEADALAPAVIVNDSVTDGAAGDDDSNDAGNVVTVPSINQGERPQFRNVIWNAGDGSDVFDIVVDDQSDRLGGTLSNAFPAGTLFRLLRADGISPLADSDASGVVDTGTLPLPIAGSCPSGTRFDPVSDRCGLEIVVEAILPGETGASDVPANGFEFTVRARSRLDGAVTNAVSNVLSAIVDSTVDVTNDVPPNGAAPGEGAGPEASPVTTRVVSPGEAALFTFVVTNSGTASDSFALELSDDLDFTNSSFALNPTVTAFVQLDGGSGDCTAPGAAVSQTPVLAPGASYFVCVSVNVPLNSVGGTEIDVYLRARSSVTGTEDTKFDRVVVAAGPAIDLAKNEIGHANPGGSVTYSHLVTNIGNVDLENVRFDVSPPPEADAGWSAALYIDINGDGVRDPADPFVPNDTPLTAAPFDVFEIGEQVRLFLFVFAPANAAFGTESNKAIVVTASPVGGGVDVSDTVNDITTAVAGDMDVLKEQALDADCDGVADGPASCSGEACYQLQTFQVVPGEQCVLYRLTATNTGTSPLFDVLINDATQPFTVYLAAAERCERPTGNCDADVSAPSDGATGPITASIGSLAAGESARLYIGLRVE